MKLSVIAICLMLGACALPMEFDPPPPAYPGPQSRSNGQIVVDVPHNRDDRVERKSASEECAQYGRTARRRSNGEYECVEPSRTEPDDWRQARLQ